MLFLEMSVFLVLCQHCVWASCLPSGLVCRAKRLSDWADMLFTRFKINWKQTLAMQHPRKMNSDFLHSHGLLSEPRFFNVVYAQCKRTDDNCTLLSLPNMFPFLFKYFHTFDLASSAAGARWCWTYEPGHSHWDDSSTITTHTHTKLVLWYKQNIAPCT